MLHSDRAKGRAASPPAGDSRDKARRSRRHVLLTNDDGVAAEGLQAWRSELLARGWRVSVIAPADNQSGMARAVNCRGETNVELVEGDPGSSVFACSGSPVDCVRVGLLSGLIEPVTVVASGINHGVNLGDDATYSGTLGAALEGALLGSTAVAVSQQDDAGDYSLLSRGGHDFSLAWLAATIVELIAARRPPTGHALSVNLPHRLRESRAEATIPSSFTYGRDFAPAEHIAPGRWLTWPYAKPGHGDPEFDFAPGTDVSAIARGVVSLSLFSARWGERPTRGADADVWLSRLSEAATSSAAHGASAQPS